MDSGRLSRALRLLMLLVFALTYSYLYTPTYNATIRSLCSPGILGSSAIWPSPRIFFGGGRVHQRKYAGPIAAKDLPPIHADIQRHASVIRNVDKTSVSWPKRLSSKNKPETKDSHAKNTSVFVYKLNVTKPNVTKLPEVVTQKVNITGNVTRPESAAYAGTSVFIRKIMEGIKNLVTTEEIVRKNETPPLPLCDRMPPDLGPIPVNKTEFKQDIVEKKFPEIQLGGRYAPPNCTARHRVAIIVPYRDRQQHLAIFLNHMHPFLMKQQIEYGIFVVEQDGNKDFNRAKLMNVGFVESQRLVRDWQCFVFHDIDLLPLDTRNLYSCPRQPRHMSASIDKLNFKLPYEEIFGGVSAVTKEQFRKMNGYSNEYWGWGAEDDDLFCRLEKVNYHVARYKMSIARYFMLDHKISVPNPKRHELLSKSTKTFQKDGLSTLEYELVKVVQYRLYTHILANIDGRFWSAA